MFFFLHLRNYVIPVRLHECLRFQTFRVLFVVSFLHTLRDFGWVRWCNRRTRGSGLSCERPGSLRAVRAASKEEGNLPARPIAWGICRESRL